MSTRIALTFNVPSLLAILLLAPACAVAQSSAEFLAVAARYGQINTIAGSGLRDACNDWSPANEGGFATSADLSRPHMAAADPTGRIYIADKEAYAIRMVDLDGHIHTVAGTGAFGTATDGPATESNLWGPNGIVVHPDGTIYFVTVNDNCDTGLVLPGGRIHKLTPDGTLTTVVEDSSLSAGRGLYVAPDQSVICYASGTVLRTWNASTGSSDLATGFVSLGNLDREAAGSFLVTDRFGHLVWRVEPDGSKSVVAGNGTTSGGGSGQPATSTGLDEVRGVAAVDTGGFFVCTHRGSQIWYVDTAGSIWLFIDGARSSGTHFGDGLPVSTPGLKISEPRAVSLAPNGDLLITENDDGYVRRVTNITIKPRLQRFDYDPVTGFRLEWTSHREGRYLVRQTNDFLNWSTSSPIDGSNGATTFFLDSLATGAPRTFYVVDEHE